MKDKLEADCIRELYYSAVRKIFHSTLNFDYTKQSFMVDRFYQDLITKCLKYKLVTFHGYINKGKPTERLVFYLTEKGYYMMDIKYNL